METMTCKVGSTLRKPATKIHWRIQYNTFWSYKEIDTLVKRFTELSPWSRDFEKLTVNRY
jgi:hypothetical protein